jgi:hypothetical protein
MTKMMKEISDLRKSVAKLSIGLARQKKAIDDLNGYLDGVSYPTIFNVTSIEETVKMDKQANAKIAIVLGARYDPNYQSIYTSLSSGICNTLFRDSVRIEMLGEMLGKGSIVKSMNRILGNEEHHISADFGRRAANIEKLKNLKNVKKISNYLLYFQNL